MQPSWFKDITEESGARFLHSPGVATNFFMPEMVGSGVALLDFDNDGRLDLYFIQNAGNFLLKIPICLPILVFNKFDHFFAPNWPL